MGTTWTDADPAAYLDVVTPDLERVDLAVLEEIVRRSWATVTAGTFGQRAGES